MLMLCTGFLWRLGCFFSFLAKREENRECGGSSSNRYDYWDGKICFIHTCRPHRIWYTKETRHAHSTMTTKKTGVISMAHAVDLYAIVHRQWFIINAFIYEWFLVHYRNLLSSVPLAFTHSVPLSDSLSSCAYEKMNFDLGFRTKGASPKSGVKIDLFICVSITIRG